MAQWRQVLTGEGDAKLEKVIKKELHNQKVVIGHKISSGGRRVDYFAEKARKNVQAVAKLKRQLARRERKQQRK